MRLTWRDAVATGLVATAAALVAADATGHAVAGFGGPRVLSTTVLVLGIAACATGAGAVGLSARWQTFVGWLGLAAFVAGIAGLLSGSVPMLRTVTGLTVAIWLLTTTRRILRPAAPAAPAEEARERELVSIS